MNTIDCAVENEFVVGETYRLAYPSKNTETGFRAFDAIYHGAHPNDQDFHSFIAVVGPDTYLVASQRQGTEKKFGEYVELCSKSTVVRPSYSHHSEFSAFAETIQKANQNN